MLELNGIKIFWLGHASFKIKTDNRIIYVDPYNIFKEEQADLILITHKHFDHFDQKSIKVLSNEKTIIIGPPDKEEITPALQKAKGASPWYGIKVGEKMEFDGISVEAVEAYNIGKNFHPKGLGVGYLIEIGKKTIYHAGDTDFIPEMKSLENRVDVALLPIGGTYTMDVREAVKAVKTIRPRLVIPMHYGSLKETQADPEEFKKLVGDDAEVKILGGEG